jgi:23S rRNA pseudouridine2605 synthase
VTEASQKLQKFLAQAGLGSRRDMEDAIRAGRVSVNGAVATIGTRVAAGDEVRVGRKVLQVRTSAPPPRVLVYHKPEGEIVSHDDPERRPSVFTNLPPLRNGKWLAIGRLDFNTCGLLVLTDSGELAHRLMHPRFRIEREYAVRLRGELSPEQLGRLRAGVRLEDGMARPEVLEEGGGTGSNRWYHLVLREGRNREVRRMFAEVGASVSRLMRVRFGPITLSPRLRRGQHLALSGDEVSALLAWLDENEGVPASAPVAPSAPPAPPASPRKRSRPPRSSRPR